MDLNDTNSGCGVSVGASECGCGVSVGVRVGVPILLAPNLYVVSTFAQYVELLLYVQNALKIGMFLSIRSRERI